MIMWARERIMEFCDKRLEVPLHCDNQSAIAVVACNGNTSRVRRMAKHARCVHKGLGPAEFERQRARLNTEDVSEAWVMVEASPDVQDDGDVEMQEV
ncbi:hypothetical protein PC110_g14076 [Phytophthora cactorum]|nr:hypothetical protein PC110_g14076 [Phytophthora cactorum]